MTTASATPSQNTARDIGLSVASSTAPVPSGLTTLQSMPPTSVSSSTTLVPSGLITPQLTSPASVPAAPLNGGRTSFSSIGDVVAGIVVSFFLLRGGAWWVWKIKKRRRDASRKQPLHVASDQVCSPGERMPNEPLEIQSYELHESDGNPTPELHASGGPIHESSGMPVYELRDSVREPRM